MKTYHYKHKKYLMSKTEHDFFQELCGMFGEDYYVIPQVHLSTLFDGKIAGQFPPAAFGHINGKSVDYVICDKQHVSPLMAIELDDKSHNRPDRSERDAEVERIFRETSLPLVRFTLDEADDLKQVQNIISSHLKS